MSGSQKQERRPFQFGLLGLLALVALCAIASLS